MQPQLEIKVQNPKKGKTRNNRFYNAQYGHHSEFTAWVDMHLARQAEKDTMGMFAKDILGLLKRTRLPRTHVLESWGLRSSALQHFIDRWDDPLTSRRQDQWLAGAHLLEMPTRVLASHILEGYKLNGINVRGTRGVKIKARENTGQGAPTPVDAPPTIEDAALPQPPTWAPWAYWAAGFILGGVLGGLGVLQWQ